MDPEKSVQQASAAQRALLEMYQEGSRFWLDRVQSEMALWADLGSKLPKTRSVPEAFEAYGKCVSQQMKMRSCRKMHSICSMTGNRSPKSLWAQ